jgi:prepilin-type N-terminal cleavage/methylation domain-containing protein/prepilin-type processing-associated H-X9-DG protein
MTRDGTRSSSCRGDSRPARTLGRAGFTLTELLVVIGLIAVLISLLLPVLSRVRAAANGAACLSNLRQLNIAWTTYLTENRGRLIDPVVGTVLQPEVAYRIYWPGLLDTYRVSRDTLLCPAAAQPITYSQNLKGAGNVNYAWSGQFMSTGTPFRLNLKTYRTGSYGYNRNLTAEGGYGSDLRASRINQVRQLSEVPVFFDCTFVDVRAPNGSKDSPVQSPPDLRGDLPVSAPQHWRFLIARHGRAINVATADGSARRVPLEETYMLRWAGLWERYTLSLPPI